MNRRACCSLLHSPSSSAPPLASRPGVRPPRRGAVRPIRVNKNSPCSCCRPVPAQGISLRAHRPIHPYITLTLSIDRSPRRRRSPHHRRGEPRLGGWLVFAVTTRERRWPRPSVQLDSEPRRPPGSPPCPPCMLSSAESSAGTGTTDRRAGRGGRYEM